MQTYSLLSEYYFIHS